MVEHQGFKRRVFAELEGYFYTLKDRLADMYCRILMKVTKICANASYLRKCNE